MRVILFQPRFVEMIKDGTKRRTIRQRARCQAGDELSLRTWRGSPYRSKQREICTRRCERVSPIQIVGEGVIWLSS